jgi:putative membrane protein
MVIYLLALLFGILAGTITGLIPGIHINLIAILLLSSSTFFLSHFSPLVLVIFIASMAITHTFLDYLPSIFLGAPDEDTILSILPGHEMLIKGRAYEAVILTLYGSLAAIFLTLLLTPLFIFILPIIYPHITNIMPFILILASVFLFYFEKKSRLWAVLIFLLAGFLGIASLNLPIKEPLLPLLTGLFGASALITSIMKKQKIPKQKILKFKQIKIKKKSIFRSLLASLIASPLVSFLPGLGSGQAAVIGSEVTGDLDKKEFLILLGAINTMVAGLAFIALYSIQKPRTGAAVAIGKLLQLNLTDLLIILTTIFISGIIAFFLTLFLARIFSKNISKIKYHKISLAILVFLAGITLIFSSWLGLLVFIVSTFLGLTCILLGIRRIHLMGCLLLPVILFYLF